MNSSWSRRIHAEANYQPGDRIVTALQRHAVILSRRTDGLLEARYQDGDCSTVTLNPAHVKRLG